jgi:hypothetical protein
MTKDQRVLAAIVCLGGFWYFLRSVDPAPRALRWATWW